MKRGKIQASLHSLRRLRTGKSWKRREYWQFFLPGFASGEISLFAAEDLRPLASKWLSTLSLQIKERNLDASCLPYRLTAEERETFNTTGILVLENTLDPAQTAALTEAADRIFNDKLEIGRAVV